MTLTLDFPSFNTGDKRGKKTLDTDKATDKDNDQQSRLIGDLEAFAWTYAQRSGELEQDGQPVANGYSGCGDGKNNPEMQQVHNVGPIPRGDWTIVGPPFNTTEHGPYVLKLTPAADTSTFGRSGFLMHGDSKEAPGTASQGCVILPRSVREQVWESGDSDLKVVAEIPSRPTIESQSKKK